MKNVKFIYFNFTKDEKLMDYCRAIIQSNEISIRVYDLTTSLLNFNASNYNLYIIRRKCL